MTEKSFWKSTTSFRLALPLILFALLLMPSIAHATTDTVGACVGGNVWGSSDGFYYNIKARSNGELTQIGVNVVTASGSMDVALYTNSSDNPDVLLGNSIATAVKSGWNYFTIPQLPSIVAGDWYFIGFHDSGSAICNEGGPQYNPYDSTTLRTWHNPASGLIIQTYGNPNLQLVYTTTQNVILSSTPVAYGQATTATAQTAFGDNAIDLMATNVPITKIPITITNFQTSNTAIPFTEIVPVNMLNWTGLGINSNLGNIEFLNSTTDAVIRSFCQSNCTTSTNAAVFALNISNGLGAAASGTNSVIVDMTIIRNSPNLYNNITTGEIAQQAGTHALAYDNGQHIYPYYQSFDSAFVKGSITNVGWSNYLNPSNTLLTYFPNSVSLDSTTEGTNAGIDIPLPPAFVGQADFALIYTGTWVGACCSGKVYFGESNIIKSAVNSAYGFDGGLGVGASPSSMTLNVNGKNQDNALRSSSRINNVTVYSALISGTLFNLTKEYNYSRQRSVNSTTAVSGTTLPLPTSDWYLAARTSNNATTYPQFNSQPALNMSWVAMSQYPPDNVTPTVTFGTPTYATPTNAIPICAGAGSCTFTIASSATMSASWPVGTYTFTANDLTNPSNSVSQTLTIYTANAIDKFTSQCSSGQLVDGTCTTTATISSIGNQAPATLTLNGTTIGSSTTSLSTTLLTNIIYKGCYTWSNAASENYSSNSVAYCATFYMPWSIQNTTGTNTIGAGSSPILPNTHGPLKLTTSPFTSYGSNVVYQLNQSYDGGANVVLESGVDNVTYIHNPLTQSTGAYTYGLKETQFANTVWLTANIPVNSLLLNNCAPAFNTTQENFTYFPLALYMENSCWFTSMPSWKLNGYSATSNGNVIDVKGSNTATLPINLEAIFNMFSPAIHFNLTSALGLSKTTLALTATSFITQTTSPSAPNTRSLFSISTYDQQFLTHPVNALTSGGFTFVLNNYTGSHSAIFPTYNSNTIWMTHSTFEDPFICLSNLSFSSSAAGYSSTYDDYLPYCQGSSTGRSFYAYLPNANATPMQFIVYQGGGYGGYNDMLLVYTGTGPSSLVQVQSYLIKPDGVPFTLELQGNQEYEFKVINQQNQTLYTSPLNLWYQTVTIQLPLGITVPSVPLVNATANCSSSFNATLNYTVLHCSGTDIHNFVTAWQFLVRNVTTSLNTTAPLNDTWFNNTSAFNVTYGLNRKTSEYDVQITACSSTYCEVLYDQQFNQQTYRPFGPGGTWIGIVLFLFSIGWGQRTKGLSVAMGTLALLVGIYVGTYNFPFYGYLGIVIVAGILVYWFESEGSR